MSMRAKAPGMMCAAQMPSRPMPRLVAFNGLAAQKLASSSAPSLKAIVAARVSVPMGRRQRLVVQMAKKSVGDLTKSDLEGKTVLVRTSDASTTWSQMQAGCCSTGGFLLLYPMLVGRHLGAALRRSTINQHSSMRTCHAVIWATPLSNSLREAGAAQKMMLCASAGQGGPERAPGQGPEDHG
jgi:hypothetical protein